MKLKDVRIGEQLAYQLLQFLQHYRADVRHLLSIQLNSEAMRRYLAAMADGDCEDAARLERALKEALQTRERSV